VTVKTRLVVFGAVLPTAALLLAVLVAGWLFERDQLQDLDRRLLAQAAVESVGLFDGPDGHPHTHVPESPIADQVKDLHAVTGRLAEARRGTSASKSTYPPRSHNPPRIGMSPEGRSRADVVSSLARNAGIARIHRAFMPIDSVKSKSARASRSIIGIDASDASMIIASTVRGRIDFDHSYRRALRSRIKRSRSRSSILATLVTRCSRRVSRHSSSPTANGTTMCCSLSWSP